MRGSLDAYDRTPLRRRFSKVDFLYLLVVIISFPGYPLLAGSAALLGANNTALSIGMRSVNVVLSIFIILYSLNSARPAFSKKALTLLVVFWIFYLLRITYDTVFFGYRLGQEPTYYWIWSVGGCLVPMLALALRPQSIEDTARVFSSFYLFTFIAVLVALFATSGTVITDVGVAQETGRMRVGNTLNPISLGHLGATMVVLSVWAFTFHRQWCTLIMRLALLIGAGAGFYLLVAANSRGPVVATFICLAIVLLSVNFRYKFGISLFAAVFAISIIPMARYIEDTYGITSMSRLFGMTVEDQVTSSSRLDLISSALDSFWTSPFIGYAIEDPSTRSYPHNVIVEAYLALGVVVGSLFVVILLMMGLRAFKILKRYPQYGWPSLLFLQYAIGAQSSGSLYSSTYMWCSIGLLVSFAMTPTRAAPLSSTRRDKSELSFLGQNRESRLE